MEQKTHTLTYVLLTLLLVALVVLLYVYVQVIWQQQTESVATESETTTAELTEAERLEIVNQATLPTPEVDPETKAALMEQDVERTATPLSAEERAAILNQ